MRLTNWLPLLLLVLAINLPKPSQATHYVGSEIFYEYIGDSTGVARQYKVSLILYRRIMGVSWGNTQTLDVTSSCFPSSTMVLSAVPGKSNVPVPQFAGCVDSMLFSDVSSYLFEGYISLPGICSDFRFSFSHCCMNTGSVYSNVYADSSMLGYYNEAYLNNTLGPNDSPISLYGGPRAFCVNQKSYWSHAATEENNDSILYELLAPLTDSGASSLKWMPGLSNNYPLNVNNYNINNKGSKGRLLSFTPTNQGIDRIRLRMSEYRIDTVIFGWVKVGETNLDIYVFYSASCSSTPSGLEAGVLSDTSSGMAGVICGNQYLDIVTSEPVLCSSIANDGSDFAIHRSSGTTVPILSANANPCGADFFTQNIRLQLFQPFALNDTLSVMSRIGRDGNTLISDCGIELQPYDTSLFYVYNCSGSVGRDKYAFLPPVSLYPNPFEDILQVKLEGISGGRVIIYDQTGRLLKEYLISESISTLNISDLEAGFYFLKFIHRSYKRSFKIRKI